MGWVVNSATPAALPPGMTKYPLYRKLDGLQGRSGLMRKILDGPGIRSPDCPACSEPLYTNISRQCKAIFVSLYKNIHYAEPHEFVDFHLHTSPLNIRHPHGLPFTRVAVYMFPSYHLYDDRNRLHSGNKM
jgi:hypothetical protein